MFDLFKLSFKSIFAKKFRTILTILGVCIGVASVILINTISDMGIKKVNGELDSLGLNGITFSAKGANITNEDLKTVAKQKGVKSVAPILTNKAEISNGFKTQNIILWGIDSNAKQVISVDILYGKAFSEYDISSKNNICLIDKSTSKKLFGRENSVGKNISILINGTFKNFKIGGIAKSDSGILQSIMGTALPCFCYIPYTTMQLELSTNTLYQIAAKIDNNYSPNFVAKEIKKIIDNEKGIKDSVSSGNLATSRMALTNLLNTVSAVFAVVGIISLLVCALGILTVMLVSVNERTREIGIKKAVGASFFNILAEFLFEALTICLIGSIIGSVLGVAIIFLGNELLNLGAMLSFKNIIIAMSGAFLTGGIFGIYPAVKAAKMNPCEALRYE